MVKHSKIKMKILITAFLIVAAIINPALALAASDPCKDTTVAGKSDIVDPARVKNCVTQTPLIQDIQSIVNFLSIGVGIIVITMIIIGGIQYSIAGDSPDATGKAKTRITNALIALVAYLFIFAFLQWIIPGGLFG